MKLFDISEPLYNGMTVWPGDDPYHYQLAAMIGKNSIANVGTLQLSTHTGTHIDAPFHYNNNGKHVHELDLSAYIGSCQVIQFSGKPIITVADLQQLQLPKTKRLLIRTDCWVDRTTFPEEYTYIQPEVAAYLQTLGVKLLGVDVPSVDPANSQTLAAHHALHQRQIHILERVVLTAIEPGEYELIAIPLPIQNGDASPVRAILRSIEP
jgi:arylformamidase